MEVVKTNEFAVFVNVSLETIGPDMYLGTAGVANSENGINAEFSFTLSSPEDIGQFCFDVFKGGERVLRIAGSPDRALFSQSAGARALAHILASQIRVGVAALKAPDREAGRAIFSADNIDDPASKLSTIVEKNTDQVSYQRIVTIAADNLPLLREMCA